MDWIKGQCSIADPGETKAGMSEIRGWPFFLSALERDKLVAEWCELVGGEVLNQVESKPQGGRPKGGEREAARQLGLSQPDVNRARKVANLSEPAQEKARELGLDDNRSAGPPLGSGLFSRFVKITPSRSRGSWFQTFQLFSGKCPGEKNPEKLPGRIL